MVPFTEKKKFNSHWYKFLEVSANVSEDTDNLEGLLYFQDAGGITKPYWPCLSSSGAHPSLTRTPFQPPLGLSALAPARW